MIKKLTALMLVFGCTSVQAASITYEFTGQIIEVSDTLLNPVVDVGASWSATFIVDTSVIAQTLKENEEVVYKDSSVGSLQLGENTSVNLAHGDTFLMNDRTADSWPEGAMVDSFISQYGTVQIEGGEYPTEEVFGSNVLGGAEIIQASVAVNDWSSSMFSDLGLLGTANGGLEAYNFAGAETGASAGIDSARFRIYVDEGGGAFSGYLGTISSVSVNAVPIPSALWLFCSGLLGMIGVARKK